MNPNSDKPSFMDRGTIIAFLVIMAFWFAWSKYMETKYPAQTATVAASPTPAAPQAAAGTTAPAAQAPAQPSTDGSTQVAAPSSETFVDYSDATWSFQVSSKGMGLKNIDIKSYKTREDQPIVLGNSSTNYPFSTGLLSRAEPIDFTIEKVGTDTFVGRANVNGLQIEKTLKVDSANYTVAAEVKVTGATADFKGLETYLSDDLKEATKGGFMAPSYDHQDWFFTHEGTKTRKTIHKADGLDAGEKNVEVVALTSHYFALALVDRSDLLPRFETKIAPQSPLAVGKLVHEPVNKGENFSIKYTGFAGPKSYSVLSSIDPRLGGVVDYGMFAIIARPLLWLMKWIYAMIGNWGLAIIGLTIIVRLIVLPFNVYSYKSMKVMQKLQPEMTRIREKYKDKPADQKLQMNQEIMELMKRHKANPVGGCLPMLLQLPVFLALYQVLGQSIELYRAPFGLWIHDLSAKDPFYVLPVLMAITMYIQQKITPTTMDPQQAKILQWMPVIFALFMLSLPSGLTLYIFVSTLFGIIQQYVLMRDKTPATTVKEAKA